MKTKLEMAHEYAMQHLKNSGGKITMHSLCSFAWQYADAMQAEADERAHREPRETHKNLAEFKMHPEYDASINYPPDAWVMYKGEKRLAVSVDVEKEWQPDWSQAPDDDVQYFAVDEGGRCGWYVSEPELCSDHWYWSGWGERKPAYDHAPSFGYTGDWRESLRKRPQ